MSLLDRYAEYMSNRKDPNREMMKKFLNPDYGKPNIFYMMDEQKGRQILRKYNNSSGEPVYAGTYRVLFKTEDLDRFCLIMSRMPDEWLVPPEYIDESEREPNTYIVAEYYPGTHCRIYLRGLGDKAVARIASRYERKTRKKLPQWTGPGRGGKQEEGVNKE